MSEWAVQRIVLAKPPRPNLMVVVRDRTFWWPWLLAVGMQGDELSVWMRDDIARSWPQEPQTFFIGCVGGTCPPPGEAEPIGTVIDGENRWAVFFMNTYSKWTP